MIRFLLFCSFFLVGGLLCADCFGLPTGNSHAHLSRVWQEEFGLPADISVPTSLASNPSAFSYPNISSGQSTSHPTASSPDELSRRPNQPHPAVVRVIVPEQGATSYGSGTLIDIREDFGLVITNWHVVRDAQGPIEVVFPGGFTSQARALKIDADWDLAALVVWRPPVKPVKMAATAPRLGDELTICGYGQGTYRSATGRCTDYYAPRPDFPRQMVELDVEARQGDSGGPIFNQQGELAGVLFGAGQGTTLGSFGGRVGSFLATLAPDIGLQSGGPPQLACCPPHPVVGEACCAAPPQAGTATIRPHQEGLSPFETEATADEVVENEAWSSQWPETSPTTQTVAAISSGDGQHVPRNSLFEQMKTVLAAVGLLSIAVQVLRAAR